MKDFKKLAVSAITSAVVLTLAAVIFTPGISAAAATVDGTISSSVTDDGLINYSMAQWQTADANPISYEVWSEGQTARSVSSSVTVSAVESSEAVSVGSGQSITNNGYGVYRFYKRFDWQAWNNENFEPTGITFTVTGPNGYNRVVTLPSKSEIAQWNGTNVNGLYCTFEQRPSADTNNGYVLITFEERTGQRAGSGYRVTENMSSNQHAAAIFRQENDNANEVYDNDGRLSRYYDFSIRAGWRTVVARDCFYDGQNLDTFDISIGKLVDKGEDRTTEYVAGPAWDFTSTRFVVTVYNTDVQSVNGAYAGQAINPSEYYDCNVDALNHTYNTNSGVRDSQMIYQFTAKLNFNYQTGTWVIPFESRNACVDDVLYIDSATYNDEYFWSDGGQFQVPSCYVTVEEVITDPGFDFHNQNSDLNRLAFVVNTTNTDSDAIYMVDAPDIYEFNGMNHGTTSQVTGVSPSNPCLVNNSHRHHMAADVDDLYAMYNSQSYYDIRIGKGTVDFSTMMEGGYLDEGDAEITAEFTVYNISGDAIEVLDMGTGGTAATDGGAGYNLRTIPAGGIIGTIRITATPLVDTSMPVNSNGTIVDGNDYAGIYLDGHLEYLTLGGSYISASLVREGTQLKTTDGRLFTMIIRDGKVYAVATATLGTQSQNPYFLPSLTVTGEEVQIEVTETRIIVRDTNDPSTEGYYVPNNTSTSFTTYITGSVMTNPHNEYDDTQDANGIILHNDGTLSNQDNVYVYDHSTMPTYNDVWRGGFTVVKADQSDANTAYMTPDDSINLTATFGLYNFSQHPVKVNGNYYQVGDLIMTVQTAWDPTSQTWVYTSSNDLLPYGTYGLVELEAPNGYWLVSDGNLANLYDEMHAYAQRYGYDYTSATLGRVPGYASGKVNGITFTIRQSGQMVNVTTAADGTPYFYNRPMSAPIAIQKVDGELHGFTEINPRAQGDATLAGAEFTIWNTSTRNVWIDVNNNGYEDPADRYVAPGDVVGVIVADENGYCVTDYGLGIGQYEIRETKAPEGYLLNETWVVSITPDMIEDAATANTTSEYASTHSYLNQAAPDIMVNDYESNGFVWVGTQYGDATMYREYDAVMPDSIIRGGVSIIKYDGERAQLDGETRAQGDATLAGAQYTIWNLSENSVLVDKHNDGDFTNDETAYDLYPSVANQIADFDNINADELNNLRNNYMAESCYTITTDITGFATTAINTLPYGTYVITETRPSPGYLLNEEEYYVFTIRENGVMVPNAVSTTETQSYNSHLTAYGERAAGEPNDPIFAQTPIRGYLEVLKYDSDGYIYRTTQFVPNTQDDPNGPVAYQLESVPQGEGDLQGGTVQFYNVSVPSESRYDGTIWYDADGNDVPTDNEYIPTGTLGRDGDGTNLIDTVEFVWMPDYQYAVGSTVRTGAYVARLPYSVPYGTYRVEESTAPQGYHWDSEWSWTFKVREEGIMYTASIEHETLLDEDGIPVNRTALHNDVYRNGMQGLKVDGERNMNMAQGDAQLSGAIIGIVNMSKNGVWTDWDHDGTIEENEYFMPGEICYWCETDMYGNWSTDYFFTYTGEQQPVDGEHDAILPYGLYRAVELAPSNGYLLNGVDAGWTEEAKNDTTWSSNHVMPEWSSNDYTYWYYDADLRIVDDCVMVPVYCDMNQLPENVVRGGLAIMKFDAENQLSLNVGGADLSDGSNRSSSLVGIEYTIWNASVTAYADWHAGELTGDGRIWYDLNGDGQRANNELFPLSYVAADNISGVTESYDGIIFFDENGNGLVDEGELKPVGSIVTKIYTEWDPNAVYEDAEGNLRRGAYVATTGARDLPFGTYIVQETATNDSYLMDDPSAYVVTIREDGVIVTTGVRVDELSVYNTDEYGNVSTGITSEMILNFVESLRNGAFDWSNTTVLGDRRVVTSEDMVLELIISAEPDIEVVPTTEPTVAPTTEPTPEPETTPAVEPTPTEPTVTPAPTVEPTPTEEPTETTQLVPADPAIIGTQVNTLATGARTHNHVIRADFFFTKIMDANSRRLQTIWVVTNVNSGERHIIMTDENGEFVSNYNPDEERGYPHSLNTNSLDYLLPYIDAGQTIYITGLDPNADAQIPEGAITVPYDAYQFGTWFGETEILEQITDVDDSVGALPFGEYDLTEVRTSTNTNVQLGETTTTNLLLQENIIFYIYRNGMFSDLGTITNDYVTIRTTAIDATTETHYASVPADGNINIIDTVEYNGLRPGDQYYLVTSVWDITEGHYVLDADGKPMTFKSDVWEADMTNGDYDVTFTVPYEQCAGHNLVVMEELWHVRANGTEILVADHTDKSDTRQMIYVPMLTTAATNAQTGTQLVQPVGTVSISDVITYTNLQPNKRYTVEGILMDVDSGDEFLDANGNEITVTSSFTTDATGSGQTTVTYTFAANESMAGKTAVVFETVIRQDNEIIVHADLNDGMQQVSFPNIETTLTDENGNDEIAYNLGTVTLVDHVHYSGLIVGDSYTLNGKLMDKNSNTVLTDAEGNEITASVTFTATSREGDVDVTFVFDASLAEGKTLVAFEEIPEVAVHADINDEDQTVRFPKIGTTATVDGEHIAVVTDSITITDVVEYSGLRENEDYVMTGYLVDKATGEAILDASGNKITSSVEFTTEASSGSVTVTFVVPGELVAGKSVVVFEDCLQNDTSIAVHADINDENQTVTFPSIGTTAIDQATGTHQMSYSTTTTVVDTIEYSGLIPGRTYTVSGTLMDKTTGQALSVAGATASKTFTAGSANGSVALTFSINTTALQGKTLVAFETLTYEGRTIATHADIEDADQSVYEMLIHTVATNGAGEHYVDRGTAVQVVDTVYYENLVVGQSYTIEGQLVDKANSNVVATATTTFISTEATGTVQVVFTVNTTDLAGHSLVAFETARTTASNVVIGEHKDLFDADQTVSVRDVVATPTPVPTTGRNQYQTGITQYATLYVVIAIVVLAVAVSATVGYIIYTKKKTAKSDTNDVN